MMCASVAWAQFTMPGEQAHKGSVTTNRLRGNRDSRTTFPIGPRTQRLATDILEVNSANFIWPSGLSTTTAGGPMVTVLNHTPVISGIDAANPPLTAVNIAPLWQYTVPQTWIAKTGMNMAPTLQSSGSIASGSENGILLGIFSNAVFNGTTGPRTLGGIYGFDSRPATGGTAGTVTMLVGFYAAPTTTSGTTVTTARGFYVADQTLVASTAATSIGIDIDLSATVTGASLSLRSVNAQSVMRHLGNVNIGTATTSGNGKLNVTGHIHTLGTAPALSACGSGSPSITGTDSNGVITGGTATPVACTATFNAAYTNAPQCFINSQGGLAGMRVSAVSTTAFTVTWTTGTNSTVIDYHCIGRE